MSCCRPFRHRLDTPYMYRYNGSFTASNYVEIPCGWCLNCRVDKRNFWADRAKFEYCDKLTASFVTLTSDNAHLSQQMFHAFDDNELVATLDYSKVTKFIQRLRHFIKYHPELQGVLCQPDFSYIFVGEYGQQGELFDRPHFHVLFFGLDFAFMKKYMEAEWRDGYIDVLPLLDGGITYVLKYMDKQLFGELAKQTYDVRGLARPKMHMSKSFGVKLFTKYASDIIKNDYTYPVEHGLRRPLSAYYKKKFTGGSWIRDYTDKRDLELRIIKKMRTAYNLKDCSKPAIERFKTRQSRLRERLLYQRCLNDGIPVFDFLSNSDVYYSPSREKISKLGVKWQAWLAKEYRSSLPYNDRECICT